MQHVAPKDQRKITSTLQHVVEQCILLYPSLNNNYNLLIITGAQYHRIINALIIFV